MKTGLTGSAINELDFLSWEHEERRKAIQLLNDLKERQQHCDKTIVIKNGTIRTYYKFRK